MVTKRHKTNMRLYLKIQENWLFPICFGSLGSLYMKLENRYEMRLKVKHDRLWAKPVDLVFRDSVSSEYITSSKILLMWFCQTPVCRVSKNCPPISVWKTFFLTASREVTTHLNHRTGGNRIDAISEASFVLTSFGAGRCLKRATRGEKSSSVSPTCESCRLQEWLTC